MTKTNPVSWQVLFNGCFHNELILIVSGLTGHQSYNQNERIVPGGLNLSHQALYLVDYILRLLQASNNDPIVKHARIFEIVEGDILLIQKLF